MAPFALPHALKERCLREYFWTDDFTEKALLAYRQFMVLKYNNDDYDATILSPSVVVDKVWHQHLLDVKHYVQACHDFTGGHLIGHNPDGGLDATARLERIKNTKVALKSAFGKEGVNEVAWSFENLNGGKNGTNKRVCISSNSQSESNNQDGILSGEGTNMITVSIRDQTNETISFRVRKCMRLGKVFRCFSEKKGVAHSSFRFYSEQQEERLGDNQTFEECGIEDGDEITCMLEQTGC